MLLWFFFLARTAVCAHTFGQHFTHSNINNASPPHPTPPHLDTSLPLLPHTDHTTWKYDLNERQGCTSLLINKTLCRFGFEVCDESDKTSLRWHLRWRWPELFSGSLRSQSPYYSIHKYIKASLIPLSHCHFPWDDDYPCCARHIMKQSNDLPFKVNGIIF